MNSRRQLWDFNPQFPPQGEWNQNPKCAKGREERARNMHQQLHYIL